MMISMLRLLGLMSLCVVVVSGCTKNAEGLKASSTSNTGVSLFSVDPSESPYYGDTILSVTGLSYQVFSPISHLGNGTYVSWPKGLYINSQTGVIDAYRSEKGARYNVGFIKEGSLDTIFSQVILSGITYPDGIYLMGTSDTLVSPIAVSSTNTSAFEGHVEDRDEHLVIDPSSGSINLSQSILAGLFGDHAAEGDTKKVTISYKLGGAEGAPQQTTIELHYYTDLSHVPASLVNRSIAGLTSIPGISGSNNSTATVGEARLTTMGSTANTTTATNTSSENTTTKASTTGTATTAAKPAAAPAPAPVSPRPPQLVIVNVGHH
jgi:hypothetical protein